MFLQRGAPLLFNERYFYCGEKYFKVSVKLNMSVTLNQLILSSCFISLIQYYCSAPTIKHHIINVAEVGSLLEGG